MKGRFVWTETTDADKRCGDCRYFRPHETDKTLGTCRRYWPLGILGVLDVSGCDHFVLRDPPPI